MKHKLLGGNLKIEFSGRKIFYNSDKSTLYHLVHSLEKIENLVKALPEKIEGAFIDGGANNGLYSILLCEKYKQNKIYAFEASNDLTKIIEKNIDSENFVLCNKAIAATTGEIRFFTDKESDQIGSTIFDNVEAFAKNEKDIQTSVVQAVSLKDFIENEGIERVAVLKLDIQGGEYEALSHNPEILEKVDILILECMLLEDQAFPLLDLAREYFPHKKVINSVAFGADIMFYR